VRDLVSGRAAAGAKSPYDLERTDLALATLDIRLSDAKTDVLAASASLAEAVGIADWHPHAAGDFRPGPEPPAGDVSAAHPSLAKPRAVAEQARAEEELAHAEASPTPSLVVASYGTSGPFGVGLTLGVQWPLPMFDRNKGAIARAHASEAAARLDAQATSFELTSQLARSREVLAARRATLVAFESGAVERLPKIRTMAEDAYRSAQGGIVELLDALDAIDDTRLRDIDLVEAVLDAELDVRAALSGD
jgi:cobalt-zinc-cadmium efflux system outer membrane protein